MLKSITRPSTGTGNNTYIQSQRSKVVNSLKHSIWSINRQSLWQLWQLNYTAGHRITHKIHKSYNYKHRHTPAEFLLAWCNQGWEPFWDREESSTSSLLSELQFSIHSITGSYARAAATSASISLTVHQARSDAYHRNLTGWWPSR